MISDLERTLAINIAETYWRRLRLQRVETAVMAARMKAISEANPDLQGDDALADLMTDRAGMKRMTHLLRYLTSAERGHTRAINPEVEKSRLDAEEEAAASELIEPEDFEPIGFVSQPRDLLENLDPQTAAWLPKTHRKRCPF